MRRADLLIRTADPEDLEAISAIENECIPDPWSEKALKYDLVENQNSRYVVAELDDVVVGFVGAWLIDYEAEINNVAVLPDVRHLGIGKMLVQGALALLESCGAQAVSLEVRETNYSAITMYKHLGFEQAAVRKGYYRDNNEDALIMRRIGNPEADMMPGMES